MSDTQRYKSATRPGDAAAEPRDGVDRPLPKRFYQDVSIAPDGDGAFAIHLDGRPIRTPLKQPLHLPSHDLAQAVAAEWEAQETHIRPETMVHTRLANTAIDRVADRPDEIVREVTQFLETDAVCYRAEHPDTLIAKQSAVWDPLLEWAKSEHGIRLTPVAGVLYSQQPAASIETATAILSKEDAFSLTALHNMTTLTGSAVIAFAVHTSHLAPEEAWSAAHVDEDHQISEWGEDAEAKQRRAVRQGEFMASYEFLTLARR